MPKDVKMDDKLEGDSCDIRMNKKIVVNSVETVKIGGKPFLARVDTGATRSSISRDIADNMDFGPIVETVKVRNAHGQSKRKVVVVEVELAGVKTRSKFNISDRSRMKYPVLIGRNLLRQGFLVDCSNENWNN